jgi:uncharacterized protein YjiS (DUF1127 family)
LGRFKHRLSYWLAAIAKARRKRRERRQRRQALEDVLAKPHDHWLHDAGVSREEAHRQLQEDRLHRIAMWASLRGRGQ